jgi:hypothetical protein
MSTAPVMKYKAVNNRHKPEERINKTFLKHPSAKREAPHYFDSKSSYMVSRLLSG